MPIQTWDVSGNVLFNSDTTANGVCLGAYLVGAGTAFYKQFPLLAGATVRVMPVNGNNSAANFTVSYPGSVPTVSASAVGYEQYVVLWATGSPAIQSGAGMQAVSSGGTIALSPNARGCNYAGRASNSGSTSSTGSPFGGGRLGYYTFSVSGSPNPPVIVLGVTDSFYVRMAGGPVSLGGGSWSFDVQAMSSLATTGAGSWPTLVVPDVYVFSVLNSPTAGAVAAVYDTDGTLAYDLLRGRVLASQGALTFPSGTGLDSYGQSLPSGTPTTLCGVFGAAPYFETRSLQRNPTTYQQSRYADFWRLSGGQLIRQRAIHQTDLSAEALNSLSEQTGTVEIINVTGL